MDGASGSKKGLECCPPGTNEIFLHFFLAVFMLLEVNDANRCRPVVNT
jgi:hypothetical protein